MWEMIAAPIVGSMVSSLLGGKSKTARYSPNPTWLAMQEKIMGNVQKGLEAGGYTWDDATNALLKRSAVESAATPYKGAQERVVSSLAPYGNVGSLGRGLVSLNTARATDEANALRNVDVTRAQNKLGSYNDLLKLGAGINDPNLPQMNTALYNAQTPSAAQNLGSALSTGLGTAMNLYQANQNSNFWNQYLNTMRPTGLSTLSTPTTPLYNRYLNTPSSANT